MPFSTLLLAVWISSESPDIPFMQPQLATDGRTIVGFAFDARLAPAADPAKDEIRVLPADSNERVRVPLAAIHTLAFTGKDAASGKSWENWIRRYAEKKLAGEAASIESEAL